jgi:hypothetical protein
MDSRKQAILQHTLFGAESAVARKNDFIGNQ